MKKLLLLLFLIPNVALSLSKCPKDESLLWTNCVGSVTFKEGGTYVGEFKDNLRHGHGIYTFASGTTIEGDFKDGINTGKCTTIYGEKGKSPKGTIYKGFCKDGMSHGKGFVEFPDGRSYEGIWKDQNFTQGIGKFVSNKGTVIFFGQFSKNYQLNGSAVILEEDRIYSGSWKNNKQHGKGIQINPNKDIWIGEWQDGKFISYPAKCDDSSKIWNDCYGTTAWEDGTAYTGEFKNDIPDGLGFVIHPSGNKKGGEVKEWQEGFGFEIKVDGEMHLGEFKNNLLNGYGAIIFNDGTIKVGEFKEGDFIK